MRLATWGLCCPCPGLRASVSCICRGLARAGRGGLASQGLGTEAAASTQLGGPTWGHWLTPKLTCARLAAPGPCFAVSHRTGASPTSCVPTCPTWVLSLCLPHSHPVPFIWAPPPPLDPLPLQLAPSRVCPPVPCSHLTMIRRPAGPYVALSVPQVGTGECAQAGSGGMPPGATRTLETGVPLVTGPQLLPLSPKAPGALA